MSIRWIHDFQLFLFDFDGLLVDTERLHYAAYQRLCARHGATLPWSFELYCSYAHVSATQVRDQLMEEFPSLRPLSWDALLYPEKKAIYQALLLEKPVPLMPGVERLLRALQEANIKRCVVTHSARPDIISIRASNPILDTIPHWITRECYTHPKPHPEPYQQAMKMFAAPRDRAIGFEDTPRGIQALKPSGALPVLVSSTHYDLKDTSLFDGVIHFSSFDAMPDQEWQPVTESGMLQT